jgi:hypothetical protein
VKKCTFSLAPFSFSLLLRRWQLRHKMPKLILQCSPIIPMDEKENESWFSKRKAGWQPLLVFLLALRDRSRVVPRSDSACVSTERFLRSGNAGFTKSRRVIGEHVSHPLVGWRSSDQDGWGLRSNLICRGIFEDFHAGSKGNLYSKIETPR